MAVESFVQTAAGGGADRGHAGHITMPVFFGVAVLNLVVVSKSCIAVAGCDQSLGLVERASALLTVETPNI